VLGAARVSGQTITTSSASSTVWRPVTVTPNTQYTLSFYAKRGTLTNAKYSIYNVNADADIVASTSYYAQINSTDFTRVSVTFTTPAGCTSINVYTLRDSGVTGTIDVRDAQLETGSVSTSYIPTTTAPVTRAAEIVTMPTSAIGWNTSEGTFVAKYTPNGQVAGIQLSMVGSTSQDYAIQRVTGSHGTWNGTTEVNTANTVSGTSTRAAASAFNAAGRTVCMNGGAIATGAAYPSTVGANIEIGKTYQGSFREITYQSRAFSNSELQAATT
jgi:hypothetical protein